MKRIFFLLPRKAHPGPQTQDLGFTFELKNWLMGMGIKDSAIHTQQIDGNQKVQLFFDVQAHQVSGLIRKYKEGFLPKNREHLEGQPEPEISAISVEVF